jgi:hypothetical protein
MEAATVVTCQSYGGRLLSSAQPPNYSPFVSGEEKFETKCQARTGFAALQITAELPACPHSQMGNNRQIGW